MSKWTARYHALEDFHREMGGVVSNIVTAYSRMAELADTLDDNDYGKLEGEISDFLDSCDVTEKIANVIQAKLREMSNSEMVMIKSRHHK